MWKRISDAVWSDAGDAAPLWQRAGVRALRVVWLAAEGFQADSCSLRASALTLASMLALVPALAASFAYVRGLGWTGERLETLLLQRATILSPEAVTTVVSWVDNISITGLGLMGALFAIVSSVSLLLQIEDAFDTVWGSPEGRGRVRRASDALILIVFAPVLVAVAASSEAALRSSAALTWLESFGGLEFLIRTGFATLWYLLVCAAFAALYVFLPTAPVDRRAAIVGGIVAGVAWQFAQSLYLSFQFGLAGYNAVYGALAQLPFLVFWMWTSWVIVLAGAEITAAMQNLAACGRYYTPVIHAAAARERLAIAIAIELADAAYARRPAPTLPGLSRLLGVPVRSVVDVFGELDRSGLVHTGGADQRQCFLSLSPASIPVERVVRAVRGDRDEAHQRERPAVAAVLAKLGSAVRDALGEATLADIVEAQGASADERDARSSAGQMGARADERDAPSGADERDARSGADAGARELSAGARARARRNLPPDAA
jgi:membrane protein